MYLATDPDRGGEAISWHLYDALGLKDDNYERVVINEITKNAVLESFEHARKIDNDLVNSHVISLVDPVKSWLIDYIWVRRKIKTVCVLYLPNTNFNSSHTY